MLESFKAALARIQADYGFYIACQTDPASMLAEYDLTPEERSALIDPDQLAEILKDELIPGNVRAVRITISGTHDWVNRVRRRQARQEPVVQEVAAIRAANSDTERAQAALRLIERIG